MATTGFICGSSGCIRITDEPAQGALFPELILPTTSTSESKIPAIFARLVLESRATGQPARTSLYGGAELVVLVASGSISLTIKRKGAPVGLTEEYTFRRDCGVPEEAERIPAAGFKHKQLGPLRADIVFYCGWKWPDPVTMETPVLPLATSPTQKHHLEE